MWPCIKLSKTQQIHYNQANAKNSNGSFKKNNCGGVFKRKVKQSKKKKIRSCPH